MLHNQSPSIFPLMKALLMTFLTSTLFYVGNAYAGTVPDLSDMIRNLSEEIPNLTALVTAFAYVGGIFFLIKGIIELKSYGETRTAGGREHGLTAPLIYLGVGSALFYLPTTVNIGLGTFWNEYTPFAYDSEENNPWATLIQSIFIIVQLIGVIAFIRGLIILTHIGSSGAQQNTMGRALTHIIGGLFCINLHGFLKAVFLTLGLGNI